MFAHRSVRPANFRNPPNLRTIAPRTAIINTQTRAGGRTQNNKPRFPMRNRPFRYVPRSLGAAQLSWAPIARKRLHREWLSDSAHRPTDSRRRPRDRAENLFKCFISWVREDRPALRTPCLPMSICIYPYSICV